MLRFSKNILVEQRITSCDRSAADSCIHSQLQNPTSHQSTHICMRLSVLGYAWHLIGFICVHTGTCSIYVSFTKSTRHRKYFTLLHAEDLVKHLFMCVSIRVLLDAPEQRIECITFSFCCIPSCRLVKAAENLNLHTFRLTHKHHSLLKSRGRRREVGERWVGLMTGGTDSSEGSGGH